ncbi:MAG: 50S ribosomal protein L23 [Desulfovibrionaceae bacterium]|nr:50S ribosomal protein L23 [Desulfovibrionaceae bacterium]
MELNYVIIRPLATEKLSFLKRITNCYGFEVHPDANKIEIKRAVEALFDVVVENVTVTRKRPRALKRQGRVIGKKSGSKKAYVKLAAGHNIPGLEGV